MNCLRLLRLTEKQCFNVYKIPFARYVSQHPLRFIETQDMWREKDGLPKRWQLIYKAPMTTAMKVASTYLTFTTSIISLGAIYYAAFVYDVGDLNKPVIIGDDVVIANSPLECFIYFGAFIALHLAVKLLLTKYVVRLYKNGDEYLAVYRGDWFNSIKLHQFHLKDFQKLSPGIILPWSDSRYTLGNKKAIILENYFKTPEYYNYLMTKQKKDIDEELN